MTLLLAIVLSFSYSIVIFLCKLPALKIINRISVYIWAAVVVVIAFIGNGSYGFHLSFPQMNSYLILNLTIYFIWAIVLSSLSNYQYGGKRENINFVLLFPIVEEILFRGVILAFLLNTAFLTEQMSIVLCGLLFGIMHVQYYGFTKAAIRKVAIAAVGGYFFSAITVSTASIVPAMAVHIVFNLSSILIDKHRRKCRPA